MATGLRTTLWPIQARPYLPTALALAGFVLNPGSAMAVTPPLLGNCVDIAVDSDRLSCYDTQVGRAASVTLPSSPASPLPASGTTPPKPATGNADDMAVAAQASGSILSRYWELDEADKRGTFNYTGYHDNFFLPLHFMQRVNQRPSTPTHSTVTDQPAYEHVEAKFQISLRTKVAQDLLLPGGDVWVGYTQQSLWQIWNQSKSAPFRDTDYQPELMYTLPTPTLLRGPWLGWSWRLSQVGMLHQSNGQSGNLSRSWNRVYALVGAEHGDVSATLRFESRLKESAGSDDNPDIVHYLGSSQIQLGWSPGQSSGSLIWRPALSGRGSVQIDWTYPFDSHKPDGLRAYLQFFHGYGETILDYNVRQTSLGVGVTIFKF